MPDVVDPVVEPGSFRDRHGRVYYRDGAVCRGLSPTALAEWRKLSKTAFFARHQEEGKIVATEELSADEAAALGTGWAGALRHERIPFVSYPYEWPFGMLRDAALLHLELCLVALDEGMLLKDASSFNVQWIGCRPVFIDVPSFETLRPGEAWAGYRQFCQLFLYPLMLQSYKNLDFHPWLRGSLEGIDSLQCRRVMSARDLLRPGVFAHVYLQSKLQGRYAGSRRSVRGELKRAGFDRELIRANLTRLSKLVAGLEWKQSRSTWSNYAAENTYSESDHRAKADFVARAVGRRRRRLVWDLGCNTGVFSELAAGHADTVVAMDADHLAVEFLYRRLRREGKSSNILPLVGNLADPSPDLGWRCLERKNLERRGRPDFVLSLALIHHMVIAANVPLAEFVAWLADLGGSLVIEFVSKEDPMVKMLLLNKEDQYDDYRLDHFERRLEEAFQIRDRLPLQSGTRFLFHCDPRL